MTEANLLINNFHSAYNRQPSLHPSHYRPQRSWGKVMFSRACVILFTGEVSASVHAGMPPPGSGHPRSRHLQETDTPGSRLPRSTHPPGADTPSKKQTPPEADTPQSRHPPAKHAGRYGQCTRGTHPTGMQPCS